MNRPAQNYLQTLSIFTFSLLLLSGCSDSSTPTDTNNTTDDVTVTTVETTTVKDGAVVETAALVSLGKKLYNK